MSRTVIYRVSDRAVLMIDPPLDGDGDPVLPVGVLVGVASISDGEAAKLTEAGMTFALSADFQTVVATAAPVDSVSVERTAAYSDLVTTYAAVITRLDDIVANGGTWTNTQIRDAVVDLARVCRRILRFIRVQVG